MESLNDCSLFHALNPSNKILLKFSIARPKVFVCGCSLGSCRRVLTLIPTLAVLRDISERGRDLEQILSQYITFVKPAFEEFCLPVSVLCPTPFPGPSWPRLPQP